MAITASVPWFASYLAESDSDHVSGDFVAIAYMCAVGLLISFAGILDDAHGLTTWFGIAIDSSPFN
jgi:hypothetical protein